VRRFGELHEPGSREGAADPEGDEAVTLDQVLSPEQRRLPVENRVSLSDEEMAEVDSIIWLNQTLLKRTRALVAAIQKETADHKPSLATGLPCKCFLCKALRGEP
jgi:hypothetical protein